MKLSLSILMLLGLSACVTTDYSGADAAEVQARYDYAGNCSVWLRSGQTGKLYCSSPKIDWPNNSGAAAAPAAPAPAAPAATGPVVGDAAAGETVFKTFCVSCHQADGTGKMGEVQMAANFVEDKTRLAKSDEELLTSIRDGKSGTPGITGAMPPWGASLNEQQRADALAYIRATFGDK